MKQQRYYEAVCCSFATLLFPCLLLWLWLFVCMPGREIGSATLVSTGTVSLGTRSYDDLAPEHRGSDDIVIFSGAGTTCSAVNLQPHRLYGFRVVHSNSYGDSDPSPVTCVE